jgi:hypothetical protein
LIQAERQQFYSYHLEITENHPAWKDEIERRDAVVIAGDSLAVDDAGARPQARRSAGSGG